jgi:hypothetical protein
MEFRFYKRIPLGGGAGVNISKSGLSTSFRGKFGSLGTSGFSIRSGIPGLSFRTSWGRASKSHGLETLLILLLFALFVYVIYNLIVLVILIIYNLILLIVDFAKYIYRIIRIKSLDRRLQIHISEKSDNFSRKFMAFSLEMFPELYKNSPFYLQEIIAKNGQIVVVGDDICLLTFSGTSQVLKSNSYGKIIWYKVAGQQLADGEYYASIELVKP